MMAKKARAELLFDASYFRRLELTGATLLLEAVAGEEVVGSILLLVGPIVSEYHLGESNAEGRRLGVTNLLLASAARKLGVFGSRWLFLGGGTDADPSNGLLRFKSSLSPHTFDFWIGGTVYDPAAIIKRPARSPGRFLSYRDQGEGTSMVEDSWERVHASREWGERPDDALFRLVKGWWPLKLGGPAAGRTVLELGCGAGANPRLFAEEGLRMAGVDISTSAIARAHARLKACRQMVAAPSSGAPVTLRRVGLPRRWGRVGAGFTGG